VWILWERKQIERDDSPRVAQLRRVARRSGSGPEHLTSKRAVLPPEDILHTSLSD
jgi:hypothetical protein